MKCTLVYNAMVELYIEITVFIAWQTVNLYGNGHMHVVQSSSEYQ